MWELDYKESWVPKNWCFWNVVLEKTLESPLNSKKIQPVHPKGDQPWVFIGRTDVEAETPILWATWCEELTHWKRPWCGERLKAGGEGGDRGWDGWMASPTQWTWVWASSRRRWSWEAWCAAVHGTLKSLLQHHITKASICRCSAFFTVQLSHPYMTTGKTIRPRIKDPSQEQTQGTWKWYHRRTQQEREEAETNETL